MSTKQTQIRSVTVRANARLHLGFFDLNGALGRKFGSLGVALAEPVTQLTATKASDIHVVGAESQRAETVIKQLIHARQLPLSYGVNVNVQQAIPAHAGLGSGTQLALAAGMAFSALYDLNLTPVEIAGMTSRGARSGIGIGTFLHGGVIVDGGRGANTLIPPVIAHADFPTEWRIILIHDASHQGLCGEHEQHAFNQLKPAKIEVSETLCRYVLMQALPALAEKDLPSFGQAIRALQAATGDYFAPVQGGRFASSKVLQVLQFLESQGVSCVGQSSWGPTGFAMVASENQAKILLEKLAVLFSAEMSLTFQCVCGENSGAKLTVLQQ
ncbi:MAG TPA: GHMP kinase [Methylophilaceae bacterium]|nr:GHMP kinase [Methylophilaceae bacterium]HQC29250.1 GHMP kinase [Methylotenera sp.]